MICVCAAECGLKPIGQHYVNSLKFLKIPSHRRTCVILLRSPPLPIYSLRQKKNAAIFFADIIYSKQKKDIFFVDNNLIIIFMFHMSIMCELVCKVTIFVSDLTEKSIYHVLNVKEKCNRMTFGGG